MISGSILTTLFSSTNSDPRQYQRMTVILHELTIKSLFLVTMRYKNRCYDLQKQWDPKTEIACYLTDCWVTKFFLEVRTF